MFLIVKYFSSPPLSIKWEMILALEQKKQLHINKTRTHITLHQCEPRQYIMATGSTGSTEMRMGWGGGIQAPAQRLQGSAYTAVLHREMNSFEQKIIKL